GPAGGSGDSGRGRRSSGGPVPTGGRCGGARGCPLLRHRHHGPAPGCPLAADAPDHRPGCRAPAGALGRGGGAGAAGRIARLCNVLTRVGGEQRHRDRVPGAPPRVHPYAGDGRGPHRAAHARRRLPIAATAPRDRRRVRGTTRPSALMRLRRHIPPVREWKLPTLDALGARRWGLALLGALLGGYLTAYLVLFPAPLLHGHGVVPRVLGLSLQEASDQLKKAGLQVPAGDANPGTVVGQKPAAGTLAAAGTVVDIVVARSP